MSGYQFDPEQAESDMAELRADRAAQRRYNAEYLRHPDPRDPDYPGDEGDEE